jgi:hypothetical protein
MTTALMTVTGLAAPKYLRHKLDSFNTLILYEKIGREKIFLVVSRPVIQGLPMLNTATNCRSRLLQKSPQIDTCHKLLNSQRYRQQIIFYKISW